MRPTPKQECPGCESPLVCARCCLVQRYPASRVLGPQPQVRFGTGPRQKAHLTPEQIAAVLPKVLALVAEGLRDEDVARQLGLTMRQVRSRRQEAGVLKDGHGRIRARREAA